MLRTLLHCNSSSQERIAIEKADQQEEAAAVANRPVAPAVEHKQQETTETSVGMPATVTMKNCDIDIDVHDAPNATIATPMTDHPERPTNLSLAKQEVSLVDASNTPSPASPISKQVS